MDSPAQRIWLPSSRPQTQGGSTKNLNEMKPAERRTECREAWTQAVDELLSTYSDVQRRALALSGCPTVRALRQ
jgi:hypothetical protein